MYHLPQYSIRAEFKEECSSLILSKQQEAFASEVVGTRHNLMLSAVPGSGKTTTLIEAAKRCAGNTVIVAFNRCVANDVKRGLDCDGLHWRKIQASTLHSIGLKNLQYRLKHCVVQANKVPELTALMIEQGRIDASLKPYSRIIEIMVMQAKNWAFGCDGAPAIEDVGAWFDMMNHFGWLENADSSLREFLILAARECFRPATSASALSTSEIWSICLLSIASGATSSQTSSWMKRKT